MQQISISRALGAGWGSFKIRPWYLFSFTFTFIALFSISIGNTLVTALAYILYAGFLAMMMRHFRGETIAFDDIIPNNSRWISFAVLALVKTVLIIFGFICFIIPGIYLSIRWMFAELLVIDQGMRPLEALKASSVMTRGIRLKLFWFTIMILIINLVGLLFLVVGIAATAVISLLATISLYEQLKVKLDDNSEVVN